MESCTIAVGVKEDDKPTDKVPKHPNHVSAKFNKELKNPDQLRTKERMG